MTNAVEPRPSIDATRVRRLFERARIVAADDFIQRETARRMLERLAPIRVDAARVLDLGCGNGSDAEALRRRFGGAELVQLDLAMARLGRIGSSAATGPLHWLRRRTAPLAVQADFGALPFPARSFDVLWSNLALHWSAAPHAVLPEWSRITRVGGLVAFSAFGPDTLREVAEAMRPFGPGPHVVPFTDMHDYGDMLIEAGFATPVVDAERVTLTYSSATALWTDVRALGGNPFPVTSAPLGRRDRGRLDDALDATRDRDGRFVLTFELIFGHAWKGEPRKTRDGDAIVRLERRR
jgi:malonyl-CoA O-methyltransferase